MNQVTEILRLAPGASESDAVARLSTLFELMSGQPGFRSAEVLRRADEPGLLLVLHSWDRIEDWQAFQGSDAKVSFSASRPASLYSFVPCGMNWRLEAGTADGGDAPFLRREVVRERVEPLSGPGVAASATFAYQDYQPDLEGTTLRLSRLTSAPALRDVTATGTIEDEVYESVYRYAAGRQQARAVG